MRSFFMMLKKFTYLIVLMPLLSLGQLSNVRSHTKAIANHKDLQHGHFGFLLCDLDSSTVLHDVNGNKSFIPASTLKVATTAAALDILGPEYTFKTKLSYSGTIEDTVLKGDLVIIGGGDPTLYSGRFVHESFMTWVINQLNKANIKQIDGTIRIDGSRYDRNLPHNWIWGDVGNYYGAGAYGFNFMDNTFHIYYKSGTAGTKAKLKRIDPPLSGVSLNSTVEAAAISSDQAYIYPLPGSQESIIKGQIPQNRSEFRVRGSMYDPGWWFASLMEEQLLQNGIRSKQGFVAQSSTVPIPTEKLLGVYSSPKLKTIVEITNLVSMNLYAECLAKEMAVQKGTKGCTTEDAVKTIVAHWASKGVAVRGWKMSDGSGLSRNNTITPRQMNGILKYMHTSDHQEAFLNSLPVAGERGTMRNMLKGTAAQGKVFAKSGYINGCRAYTGYVEGKSGKMYSFVLMANNYTCSNSEIKRKFTKVMIAMAGLP